MNRALCNKCQKLVPASYEERENRMYLVKDCPECGLTETFISSDARRYKAKRKIDQEHTYRDCRLTCTTCCHVNPPALVFIDITNRCNLNCPICINNTPHMGYLFEPPFEYFKKIFEHLAQMDPRPAIQFFGGEPTVRDDLFDLISLARRLKLPRRVVTNGVKLANEEYCKKLIESKATILIAYDGNNPDIYKKLRGSEKILGLKQKALDNIAKFNGTKTTLMTLVAKDFNDKEMPDFFRFCHKYRQALRGVYFMSLTHSWDTDEFNYEPERTTTEDIEKYVADAFPGETIEFLPAGFLGQLTSFMKAFNIKPLPFLGAHPNCESLYLLISDGEKYVPISYYLKSSIYEVADALRDADARLKKHVEGTAPRKGIRKLLVSCRAIGAITRILFRHVRIGRLLEGRGIAKLYHLFAIPFSLLIGKRSSDVFERHLAIHESLQVVIFPFEDNDTIETQRLERCPAAFAYYEPENDKVGLVPTCAWNLFKNDKMREIAEFYRTHEQAETSIKAHT